MDIRQEVINILINKAAELFLVDPTTLNENTSFVDDLGCKSVNMVQFTSVLEDEYDMEVPYMEFNRKKTFKEAADYIAELCGQ